MTMGRPTDYRPEYCQKVIEMGKLGKHTYVIARDLNVVKNTLYEWAKKHPDFADAFMRAREYSKAWMIQEAVNNLSNRNFQPKLFEFMMKFLFEAKEVRTVELPAAKKAKTFAERSKIIMDAALAGRITPDEAKTLVDGVSISARIEEVTELKATLERIKEKQNK